MHTHIKYFTKIDIQFIMCFIRTKRMFRAAAEEVKENLKSEKVSTGI